MNNLKLESLGRKSMEQSGYANTIGRHNSKVIPIEECIPIHKIRVKGILQDLRDLEVGDLNVYFVISTIPHLPPSISSLIVSNNSIYSPISCLEQVLNKFDNLKVPKLTSVYTNLKDYTFLMSRQFPYLEDFCFSSVSARGLKEIIVDLNNYSKLESFAISAYSKLKLNSVSNLKELTLIACNLMNQVANSNAPKTKSIIFKDLVYCFVSIVISNIQYINNHLLEFVNT
ncbi:hypothetical protein K502DRAFT_345781 [Neoconidiobolus thromboides FSU 785]|nr:hypothetical protein K502DRAFT_345781 [Neoconidiobolus thromboides FSU 785]